jgi:hypothetical protein
MSLWYGMQPVGYITRSPEAMQAGNTSRAQQHGFACDADHGKISRQEMRHVANTFASLVLPRPIYYQDRVYQR